MLITVLLLRDKPIPAWMKNEATDVIQKADDREYEY